MKNNVRTVKVTDKMGNCTPMELEQMRSRARARALQSVEGIKERLHTLEIKFAKEISRTYPDESRVTRLREIIDNLSQTVRMAQR